MLCDEITIEIRNDNDLGRCRTAALELAIKAGFHEHEAWDLAFAVFEACVNAVIHGNKDHSGKVTTHLARYEDRFEAVIQNPGKHFMLPDKEVIPPPTAKRGRGIPLMKEFMDEVRFEFDQGTKVTLIRYLPD